MRTLRPFDEFRTTQAQDGVLECGVVGDQAVGRIDAAADVPKLGEGWLVVEVYIKNMHSIIGK
ncbi:MAG: hypothetical protein ABIH23_05485 [bacterium]